MHLKEILLWINKLEIIAVKYGNCFKAKIHFILIPFFNLLYQSSVRPWCKIFLDLHMTSFFCTLCTIPENKTKGMPWESFHSPRCCIVSFWLLSLPWCSRQSEWRLIAMNSFTARGYCIILHHNQISFTTFRGFFSGRIIFVIWGLFHLRSLGEEKRFCEECNYYYYKMLQGFPDLKWNSPKCKGF